MTMSMWLSYGPKAIIVHEIDDSEENPHFLAALEVGSKLLARDVPTVVRRLMVDSQN